MERLFYTIGEVADMLEVNVSLVRYWSDNFSRFLNNISVTAGSDNK